MSKDKPVDLNEVIVRKIAPMDKFQPRTVDELTEIGEAIERWFRTDSGVTKRGLVAYWNPYNQWFLHTETPFDFKNVQLNVVDGKLSLLFEDRHERDHGRKWDKTTTLERTPIVGFGQNELYISSARNLDNPIYPREGDLYHFGKIQ
jgi:hypothetical protein